MIIQEFQECCRQGRFSHGPRSPPEPPGGGEDSGVPSKARLKRIISESSVYEKRPEFRMCWYVHAEVLRSFGQEQLPVPCQWNYVTQVPCTGKEEGGSVPGVAVPQPSPLAAKRKAIGSMSITKFMKRPRGAEQVSSLCPQYECWGCLHPCYFQPLSCTPEDPFYGERSEMMGLKKWVSFVCLQLGLSVPFETLLSCCSSILCYLAVIASKL